MLKERIDRLPVEIRLIPLVFLLIILVASSCEKDDICVEGETPLLGIAFFNNVDSITEKSVNSLRIVAIGQSEPPDTFTDRGSLSEASIPLNVVRDTTEFLFIQNSSGSIGEETGNIDTVQIIYFVDPTYVSRACGFIAEFDSLRIVVKPDASPWILGAEFTANRLSNNQTDPLLHVYF